MRHDISAAEDSHNPHLSIHDRQMIEIPLYHEPLRLRGVLILVTEKRAVRHRVANCCGARIVTMTAGLAVWIGMIDRTNQFAAFHHGPGICIHGTHAVSRSFNGVSGIQRTRFSPR
jgi:hypothetical protein